jgi:hypothetical protein
MNTLPQLWQKLQAKPPAPGNFDWLPCVPGKAQSLGAGLLGEADGPPRLMLLLQLPRGIVEAFTPDNRHKGLRLARIEHGEALGYLALILDEEKLNDVFAALAFDIAQACIVQTTPTNQLRAFVKRLEHWEELLRAFNSDGLSERAQQGLFGELYILRHLLEADIAPARAVSAWVGPLHQAQDFIVPEKGAAEVKTIGQGSTTIKVSSGYQLDESPFNSLFLVAIYLGPADSTAQTLPEMVAALTLRLDSHPDVLESLTLRLRQAGYFDIQAARYKGTAYSVQSLQLLKVHADFPRLRHPILPAAIPTVSYSLDLSGLAAYARPFPELLTLFSHG